MTLRLVTFKVEEELLEKLDKIAIQMGVSRSTVIRWAIEYYLQYLQTKAEVRVIRIK